MPETIGCPIPKGRRRTGGAQTGHWRGKSGAEGENRTPDLL